MTPDPQHQRPQGGDGFERDLITCSAMNASSRRKRGATANAWAQPFRSRHTGPGNSDRIPVSGSR